MSFLFWSQLYCFQYVAGVCVFFLAIESFRTTKFMWNACFGVRPTDSAHRQKKIIAKTIIRICPFRQILSCSNLPTSSVELIWPITELYFRQILSTDSMNRFCQDVKAVVKYVGGFWPIGVFFAGYRSFFFVPSRQTQTKARL